MRWSESRPGIMDSSSSFHHFKQLDVMVFGSCDHKIVVHTRFFDSHACNVGLVTCVQLSNTKEHTEVPEPDSVSRSGEESGSIGRQSNVKDPRLSLWQFISCHSIHIDRRGSRTRVS